MQKNKQTSSGKIIFISLLVMALALTSFAWLDQKDHLESAYAAIQSGDNNLAKLHIGKLKDLNKPSKNKATLLMVACEYGNKEIIKNLLDLGADVNYTVGDELTPLEIFCSKGYEAGVEALSLLLDAGAKQSQYKEMPPILHLASKFDSMTEEQLAVATEAVVVLLKKGAPLQYEHTTILHLAAQNNMAEFFDMLVHTKQGLPLLAVKDANGMTPWNVAVRYSAIDVQKVIRALEEEGSEDFEAEIE